VILTLLCVGMPTASMLLALLVRGFGFSVWDSAPLRREIQSIAERGFNIPIFATTAHPRDLYDPDDLTLHTPT
jgi:hypothetical protein